MPLTPFTRLGRSCSLFCPTCTLAHRQLQIFSILRETGQNGRGISATIRLQLVQPGLSRETPSHPHMVTPHIPYMIDKMPRLLLIFSRNMVQLPFLRITPSHTITPHSPTITHPSHTHTSFTPHTHILTHPHTIHSHPHTIVSHPSHHTYTHTRTHLSHHTLTPFTPSHNILTPSHPHTIHSHPHTIHSHPHIPFTLYPRTLTHPSHPHVYTFHAIHSHIHIPYTHTLTHRSHPHTPLIPYIHPHTLTHSHPHTLTSACSSSVLLPLS